MDTVLNSRPPSEPVDLDRFDTAGMALKRICFLATIPGRIALKTDELEFLCELILNTAETACLFARIPLEQ